MKYPNVLIFVMDTQRADRMSCYGYEKPTTPNVDRIASEGVLFLNNISPGIWTLPSHASLLTGRYVSGHGADAFHEFLPPGIPTIADILGKLGYQSVAFSNNSWVHVGWEDGTGVLRGFREVIKVPRPRGRSPLAGVEEDYVTSEEVDKGSLRTVLLVRKWLRESWNRSKPFLMFINCIEPHMAYWPPQPFRRKFLPPGVTDEEARKIPQDPVAYRAGALRYNEREWKILRGLYDGEVATLDNRIGRLYNVLEEEGVIDDTIIIITSDHGEVIGDHEPYIEHHLCAYEELIRVPLIMRYPDALPKGKKIEFLSQTLDIFPTILDLLGIDRSSGMWRSIQGVSLLPALEGKKPREFALCEYRSLQQMERIWRRFPEVDIRPFSRWFKVYRTERYKYIWYSDGRDELYDLKEDPRERRNLVSLKPGLAKQLRNKLEKVLLSIDQVDYGDRLRNGSFRRVNEEVLRRLRAWGFYRAWQQIQ